MFDYNNAFKRAAKNVYNLTSEIMVSKPFFRLQNVCQTLQKEIFSLANRSDEELAQAVAFQVQLTTVSKRLIDVLTSCQLLLKLG